jgi:hypothetical protein
MKNIKIKFSINKKILYRIFKNIGTLNLKLTITRMFWINLFIILNKNLAIKLYQI